MQSTALTSLPYHEPGIVAILVQSSLLLLLNVVNFFLDKALYCGLLGQVFLGVAWGTPGAKWLGGDIESAIVQLGYLGLLLLVYEGGLSTSFTSLKANMLLSLGVAITGICVPIGLSFILSYIVDATPLQSFAAGAALCSTSLGTTFTVLGTSGLAKSRLGVVLTSAAMMDDVVGLVMVQVISNLGQGSASLDTVVIVRPLLVSLAFAAFAPLVCVFIAKPFTSWLNARRARNPKSRTNQILKMQQSALSFHAPILLGCVAAASYAGTSNLFAAYIAGASISWWDSEVPHPAAVNSSPIMSAVAAATTVANTITSPAILAESNSEIGPETREGQSAGSSVSLPNMTAIDISGLGIYEKYYATPVNRVLRPFFFASIGFSIPVTEMFTGEIVWKGLVYTVLMVFGKLVCGVWLLRLSFKPELLKSVKVQLLKVLHSRNHLFWCIRETPHTPDSVESESTTDAVESSLRNTEIPERVASAHEPLSTDRSAGADHHATPDGIKPRSVYPASVLGCAMVARGEIGFLISSIAESRGIFASGSEATHMSSSLFLIITWAIVLCTILGPLTVGLLVQRIKKLQGAVEKRGGRVQDDVLGVWGVS